MRVRTLLGVIAVAAMGGVAACEEVAFPGLTPEEFQAALAGANEVPPVTSTASGTALFFVIQGTFLVYRIDVSLVDSPTTVRLHQGAAGAIGPVVLTLYSGPTRGLDYTGVLGQTTSQLRPSQLTLPSGFGATPRARYDSLVALLRTGNAYVNVRTRADTAGHIRGQLVAQ